MRLFYLRLAIIRNNTSRSYLPLTNHALLLLVHSHPHSHTHRIAKGTQLFISLTLTYSFTHILPTIEINIIWIHVGYSIPLWLYDYLFLMIYWIFLPKLISFLKNFWLDLMRHLSIYVTVLCFYLITRIIIVPRIHHHWLFYHTTSFLTFG